MNDAALKQVLRPVSILLQSLNTPRALTIMILVRAGEWDQIALMQLDPRNYLDVPAHAERFRRDLQATELLRKLDCLDTSFSKREAALENFQVSEKKCAETNYMIKLASLELDETSRRFMSFLRKARNLARKIMGPLPDRLEGRFGPGTSFEMKGLPFTTVADKVAVTPHVTPDCLAVFNHTTELDHHSRTRMELGLPWVSQTRGNRFTTVPKDAKTDRGICVEPLGNLYCQLGIGSHLKKRLERYGIFVNRSNPPDDPVALLRYRLPPEGQAIHRCKARLGSLDGSLATIDLSNASDTISYELIRHVIPSDWFALMASVRSPFTLFEGRWVRLEKFSSMGNGFTFELETIVFLCLIWASNPDLIPGLDLLVYGDDIILPVKDSDLAVKVLRSCGFEPNPRKCFSSGPFRESCGGDYFLGYEVRPYYLKSLPASPIDWFVLCNQLTRRFTLPASFAFACHDKVDKKLRFFGPKRLGDTCFWSNDPKRYVVRGFSWDVIGSRRIRSKSCSMTKYCRVVRPITYRLTLDRWSGEFGISLALLGVSSNGIVPRDAVIGYRPAWLSIS